uniref:Uncharacterized protein n=1 Tax=Rhizophora mucronata TaxID=61149 RepID=A0A2P2LNI8_RHIMU
MIQLDKKRRKKRERERIRKRRKGEGINMRARLVVFPVRGRNWCFGRCMDPSVAEAAAAAANTPSTFRDLWTNLSTSPNNSNSHNAELCIDFLSTKMNRAWMRLEKAPEGSFKNKLHGLGLKLLTRLKPSEIFLKSISKEVSCVEITYPSRFLPSFLIK